MNVPPLKQPPPMPCVKDSHRFLSDARDALNRGLRGWNIVQVKDAIHSARFFIDQAESTLNQKATQHED